jgi:hypothetical protein
MFCPSCKAEYREGFTRCADCDVDLVPKLAKPAADEAEESIVVLWQGDDPVAFSAVTSALRAAQVPFDETLGQDHNAHLADPFPARLLYSRQFEVRVLERDLPAAQETIREFVQDPTVEDAPSEEPQT